MDVTPQLEAITQIAYSYKETVYHTYNTTKELIEQGIEGCFVECGLGAGAQIMAMKLAIEDCKAHRAIWGFDSFEGIPLAGPNDADQPGIGAIQHDTSMSERERLVSSGITVHNKFQVENNFKKLDVPTTDIYLIPGWFQDTLPKIGSSIGKIALLRLDGDLYESTIVCLESLYQNVVNGGVVICDDNALEGANKAVRDFFGSNMPEMINVDGGGGVAFFIKK